MWCVFMICVLESFSSLSWYISIKWQNIFVCYILKTVPINILLLYVCILYVCMLYMLYMYVCYICMYVICMYICFYRYT